MDSAHATALRRKYPMNGPARPDGIRHASEEELTDLIELIDDETFDGIPGTEMTRIIRWADGDGDLKISAEEFIAWLLDRRMWTLGKDPVDGN